MTVPEATRHPDSNNQTLYIICIVIGVLAFAGIAALVGYSLGSDYANRSREAATVSVQPVVAPTPSPTPAIPETVVFTVLSTSPSPHYTITTTTGAVYFCKDYYDWNALEPQNTYSAIVDSGMLSGITLIASHYDYSRDYAYYGEYSRYTDYPYYYYYGGRYYQYDGHTVDEIGWKQARGQYIRYAKPPVGGYGAANPDIPYGSGNPWQG